MVKVRAYDYLNGKGVLERNGLLREIDEIFRRLKWEDATHPNIQLLLEAKGWEKERRIFEETTWRWDAYKDYVAVSIEFSLIDAVQRDLLRALLLKHMNRIDALVVITYTAISETNFENIKKHIELFAPILTFPIYLVGLEQK